MLSTERLDLVPSTVPTLRAAIEDSERLGMLLDARVPGGWPPDLLDAPALQWTVDRLREDPNAASWYMYWIVLRGEPARTLVGVAGYKGPPSLDGIVEIGYGVVPEHQRRGYATEAAQALVRNAFAEPKVQRVIAETLPSLEPSMAVLAKCGFDFIGEGSEPGVIRYERRRS